MEFCNLHRQRKTSNAHAVKHCSNLVAPILRDLGQGQRQHIVHLVNVHDVSTSFSDWVFSSRAAALAVARSWTLLTSRIGSGDQPVHIITSAA